MKITWLTQRHPPERGGMSCSSERIVNSLRDSGHAVHVIHFTKRPQTVLDSGQDRYFQSNRLMANWHRQSVTGINAPAEPEHLFRFFRHTMEGSVIVGFGGGLSGYLAVLWAKWLNTGSAVLFRGNDFEKSIHDTKNGWVTHFILKHADVVGGVSTEMTERLAALRTKLVIYTPNIIDTTQWTLFDHDLHEAMQWKSAHLPKGRKTIVGMFGQLKAKKGVDFAVSVIKSLGMEQPVFLMTVGDLSEDVSQHLESIPLKNRCHIPFQKRDTLPLFYAASDIVFIPSIYDGMPNVLLEAMALGRIIVASRAGGIPDLVRDGENGFLFNVGDTMGAVNALTKALSLDEESRQEIQIEARKTVEEMFFNKTEVHQIERMLEKAN